MVDVCRAALLSSLLLIVSSGSGLADDQAPNWTKPVPSGNAASPLSAPSQATIPFARQHGLFTWHVVDEKTVYVQAIDRQWYKAQLMFPCIGLPFAMNELGFTFEPNGDFDKFSEIVYEHQRCPLVSLIKSDPPPGYKGKRTAANPPAAVGAQAAPATAFQHP